MSDSKDWVTIRIPEPTRDAASDDPRTYEEIMQAGLDGDGSTDPTPEMDIGSVLEADKNDVQEILYRLESLDSAGVDEATLAEYVADYLVNEYQLPREVAKEVRQ